MPSISSDAIPPLICETLTVQVLRRFEALGLTGSRDQPLHLGCPQCEECWRSSRYRKPPQPPPRSVPRAPWIGTSYLEGRVAVVAINSRENAADPYAEARVTNNVIDQFANHRTDWGGSFHYNAARCAAVGLAIRTKTTVLERPEDPANLIEVLLRTARVQAIQCAPDDGGRMSPRARMRANCAHVLLAQLEILEPCVMVLLGSPPRASVTDLFGASWSTTGRLRQSMLTTPWGEVAAFGLPHPAHGSFHAAYRQFVADANDHAIMSEAER